MTIDPTKVQFASAFQVDKIIGTYTGSFISPAPTFSGFSTTATDSKTTNIPAPTFFQGLYSIDNGTTWNDFPNQQLVLPPGIFFPYFTFSGKSIANTFTVTATNFYNSNTSSGNAYTVLYKVALIATPVQGIITPQPIGTNVFFSSKYNYQKIATDSSTPVSIVANSSHTYTIPHNLGYIPKIRQFFFNNVDSSIIEQSSTLVGSQSATTGIYIDTANAYVTLFSPFSSALNGILYVRIYYDN